MNPEPEKFIYCDNCDAKLKSHAIFCSKCGEKISSALKVDINASKSIVDMFIEPSINIGKESSVGTIKNTDEYHANKINGAYVNHSNESSSKDLNNLSETSSLAPSMVTNVTETKSSQYNFEIDKGPWYIRQNGKEEFGPISILPLLRLTGSNGIMVRGEGHDKYVDIDIFSKTYIQHLEASNINIWTPPEVGSNLLRAKNPVKVDSLELIQNEVDDLIGMRRAKQELAEAISLIKVSQLRAKSGFSNEIGGFHAVFSGNPGTGKTSFARIYAKALYALGIVQKSDVIEVSRTDLVAAYQGQTAIKTRAVIEKAIGGTLFIDEAYSLITDTNDSYGEEALAELIKSMEDRRHELVVILAGYSEEMENLIHVNPGLKSRILSTVYFDDYSNDELIKIAESIAKKRNFIIDSSCIASFNSYFYKKKESAGVRSFGNAREARNAIDMMTRSHATRVASINNPSDAILNTLVGEDLL